jgi:hypothetical protein
MAKSKGWIGVDLDGTLAHYDGWKGVDHIGEPIPSIVERVKSWIEAGETVKIFTARVCDGREETVNYIKAWCLKHIGQELEVTNIKDYGMYALWDDRAVQVVPNQGIVLQEYIQSQTAYINECVEHFKSLEVQ